MKTERILGALYGQALGDAMGMPSELWPRSRVKAHFGWIDRFLPGPKENNAACYFNRAEFTDDTSMALCLADALLEREGKIDPDLIGRNILDWALRFDAFNKNVLGPTSKIALNAIRDGKPVAELENNGVTNGAAMRVSPLGCLLPARDVDSFIDDVALASSPTHKSDLAVAGAVVIAWAISRAIDGESWSAIVDSLPSIARHAQQKRITTFSASLAARLEIALKIVRNADGTESASEQLYQVVGAGTSTIECRQPALNGQRGDGALDTVGQRVIVETQPLQQRINSPSTQHRWHAPTQSLRTGMRHMNSEIKTGGEAHRLFHQFFAELQRSCTFTGCKHRIRVLYLAVIRLLKISHTILRLQCAEGVSTERSLELFRAYNYTPRIAELLAIRFKWAPVIFS